MKSKTHNQIIKELADTIKAKEAEMQKLRKIIWLIHGCDISSMYGDDGEMRCNKCMVDFKRMSVKEIILKIHETRMDDLEKRVNDPLVWHKPQV